MTEGQRGPGPSAGSAPKVLLEEVNWVEAKEILSKARIGIVPVGATEQHGPHLPLLVDTAAAAGMAKRTAEKIHPLAVVTPAMEVGVSHHHLLFPGSLTISEETLVAWCQDMAWSLKHNGIELVFFLNGHWGNKTSLALATRKIRTELDIKTIALCYWDLFPDEHRGIVEDGSIPDHAAEFETSLTLAFREGLVKKGWKRAPDAYTEDPKMEALFRTADDLGGIFRTSKDGLIIGDPAKATKEKGEKIIDVVSNEIVKFLRDLLETYV